MNIALSKDVYTECAHDILWAMQRNLDESGSSKMSQRDIHVLLKNRAWLKESQDRIRPSELLSGILENMQNDGLVSVQVTRANSSDGRGRRSKEITLTDLGISTVPEFAQVNNATRNVAISVFDNRDTSATFDSSFVSGSGSGSGSGSVSDLDELWTSGQLADYLQVSTGILARWRTNGTGPTFVKFGGNVRYRTADVQAYVNSFEEKTKTKTTASLNSSV